MNILVTGATGFVGSALLPRLIDRYGAASVSAYVLPGDRIPESWAGRGVCVYEGDIADREAVRLIGRACGRKSRPIPAWLVAAGGGSAEGISTVFKKRPLITFAYGRLSGWRSYYDGGKSVREFEHVYRPVEQTVADGWEYDRRVHQAHGVRKEKP